MPRDHEAILGKTQLFAALTPAEMRALYARVSKKHFDRGESLFNEGAPCTVF